MTSIQEVEDTSIIRFNRLSDYPLSNLTSKTAIRHLVWLLMSDDNRYSFNSIYQSFIESEGDNWNFDFELPNLLSFNFKGMGFVDGDVFVVNEITEFSTPIINDLPNIEIYHPNKKEPIVFEEGQSDGQRKPLIQVNAEVSELDLKEGVNKNRKHEIYRSKELKQIIKTFNNIEVQRGVLDPKQKKNTEIDETKPNDISGINSGPGVNGNAKELDYQINTGLDDDEEPLTEVKPTDRLKVISNVLTLMASKYENIELISFNSYVCPKPDKINAYYYYEGTEQARAFLWGQLKVDSTYFHILEIDNTGEDEMKISTPVIEFKQGVEYYSQVISILSSCVEAKFKWDSKVIKGNAEIVEYISHPAKTFETGSEDHINRWLGYFINRLKKIGYDLEVTEKEDNEA